MVHFQAEKHLFPETIIACSMFELDFNINFRRIQNKITGPVVLMQEGLEHK